MILVLERVNYSVHSILKINTNLNEFVPFSTRCVLDILNTEGEFVDPN